MTWTEPAASDPGQCRHGWKSDQCPYRYMDSAPMGACAVPAHGRSETYCIAYAFADRQGERFPGVFADWATDCGRRDGEHVDAAYARYLRGMDRLAFALGVRA